MIITNKRGKSNLVATMSEIIGAVLLLYILWVILKVLLK